MEYPRQPDYINFRPTLDTVGNNPAKMVTLMIMANAGEALSKTGLLREFHRVQGENPGWILGRGSNTPFSYCEQGLYPRLADQTEIASSKVQKNVKAFRINEQGILTGIPLCGALLGLELEYEHTSTGRLLGYSNTTNPSERMPSLRFKLFEYLLDNTDYRFDFELKKAIGKPPHRKDLLIPDLKSQGIVEKTDVYAPSYRRFKLIEPPMENLNRGGSRTHPETYAVFLTIQDLVSKNRTTMNGEELLDEISIRYPQFDKNFVWKRITTVKGINRMMESFETDGIKKSSLRITKEYREIIERLVGTVCQLEQDPDYRQDMTSQAQRIMSNSGQVSYLLKKARNYSSYKNILTKDEWLSKILPLVPEGGIDSKSLYALARQTSPTINYTSFRRMLKKIQGDKLKLHLEENAGGNNTAVTWVELASREQY